MASQHPTASPPSPTTYQSFAFLQLPPEVRRLVYFFYFVSKGEGYLYNPDTGCLILANRCRIDLNLMYTCRLVATETRHLPLQFNSITFRPGGPSTVQQRFLAPQDLWTGRGVTWDFNRRQQEWQPRPNGLEYNFPLGALAQYREFITPLVVELTVAKFPQLEAILDYIVNGTMAREMAQPHLDNERKAWYLERNGEAPSIMTAFRDYIMELVAELHPDFYQLEHWRNRRRLLKYHPATTTPAEIRETHDDYPDADNGPIWLLPTICSATYRRSLQNGLSHSEPPREYEPSLTSISLLEGNYKEQRRIDKARFQPPVYSAAALAVSFLQSLDEDTRLNIRHIILQEQQQSFACPSQHGQGLIPFCRENKRLSIERYVSVLGALQSTTRLSVGVQGPCEPCETDAISATLALWLVEADALFTMGMPKDSFRFIFDCGSKALLCSSLFQTILQRDCAWQQAFDTMWEHNQSQSSFWTRRRHNCCIFTDFPKVMKRLLDPDDAAIRCNFDPGRPWDPLPGDCYRWGRDEWDNKWSERPEFSIDYKDLTSNDTFIFTTERSGWRK